MAAKKLNLKDKYRLLTRDLDWEFSYQDREKAFPFEEFEGIKITDWSKWEDPFRLTMDSYWKYQAEKEKKLYAIFDAFSQNNGHLNVTDERYVNALKIFLTGVSPLEYQAFQGFAHTGRQLGGVGARTACQMQSLDELRHVQTQIHAMSHYNKFFDGFQDFSHMHDRVWYLSVPKSFFNDARSAGPFEFMVAIGFSFEYVLTNLLFVPFMSGAAHNGDMATVTFGFSAQSDEARHMTLGLEVIKFLLEQHEDNLPIVQKWIDKWFWRGTRLLTLVAMMMDYMLPNKVMSWKDAWEVYFEEAGGALFKDLARYMRQVSILGFHRMRSWIGYPLNTRILSTNIIVHAGKWPRRWRRKAIAFTPRRYRSCVPLVRSLCCLPKWMILHRSLIAAVNTKARSITSVPTAVSTSLMMSRKNISNLGYQYTRSSRVTVVVQV